jgi:hypothetical protein
MARLAMAKIEAGKFRADIFTVPGHVAAVVRDPVAPPPLLEYLSRQGFFTGPWPVQESVGVGSETGERSGQLARPSPPAKRPWGRPMGLWLVAAGIVAGLGYFIYPRPKPREPVRIVVFEASPETIDRGECAVLSWDLTGKAQVRLSGGERRIPTIDGMITTSVCPNQTTIYELRVLEAGVETDRKTRKVQVRHTISGTLRRSLLYRSEVIAGSN